ncbi:MAG: ABC-F family ATP-binding cassette domain-containing protein [Deltaproteobacteria bacterium]|nr:ABC-F family ATP-binding cassette domain-containing protein [Deltaproteobacteria bacterium]
MLTLTNLSKSYGARTLFRDVSLQLNPGCRYGVVGANGSGKSTLLRIISGDEESSTGDVSMPRRARLGVLRQDHFAYEQVPILDVVMMGNAPLWAAMQEKEEILARAHEHFDADRYAEVEDVILQNDGYSLESVAAEILEGLAIPTAVHRQAMSTLSGGFKLRVLLAQVLASNPDILLLDEPTNHLDILSIRWLEKFLGGFSGCALVISHDHRFLDNVCTHIVDVDYERALQYTGNYSEFEEAKTADRDRMEHEIGKQKKEIADQRAFIERFKAKASKARQAQSRVKRVEKMVIEKLPESSRRYPTFIFKQKRPSGRKVLGVEGVSKAYGDKQVLRDVSFDVQRDDRLAIIGPNGIGKSTLLKIIMAALDSDAGSIEWGHEVYPGWFAQDHHDVLGHDEAETVQSWLYKLCPGESIGFVRGNLAQVLFSKDDVDKRVENLSGGEGARLVFAGLAVTKPNLLILDEPTNHLDMEGIESLAAALLDYDGTIIFVSHDRWFVGEVANRIIEIRPDGLFDFPGTYEEYLVRCGDDHLDADAAAERARRDQRAARRA